MGSKWEVREGLRIGKWTQQNKLDNLADLPNSQVLHSGKCLGAFRRGMEVS